jgi:uncharacterized protein YdeI (YjbR/CyaY-like superfamily)
VKRAKSVNDYVENASAWQGELKRVREILLSTELREEVKWGGPCYTYNGKNVVGMAGFKSYFGLWFHQGALLKDRDNVLINAQEGKTRALRQWRMQTAKDIKPALIRSYVKEAIELAKAGKQIAPADKKTLVVPADLKKALQKDEKASENFKNLRPGLQREYAEYISEAKREDTRRRRIGKILPMIRKGAGLHDKYRAPLPSLRT